MKQFLSLLISLLSIGSTFAAPSDTIKVSQFGVLPGSYENCVTGLQAAIDSCRANPGSVLLFDKGRYDIWPEGAVRKEIYISNTSSEVECPSKVKIIGIHLYGLDNIVIEGSGATLMMHGQITPLAIDSSRHVTLKNLTIDFERPGGSELTYKEVSPGKVVMTVHPDTRYDIVNGHINLIGEGWRSNKIHCISYSAINDHATYSGDWRILEGANVQEISPGLLSFSTPENFTPEVGATLTLRDIIRDQVGTLILESKDIALIDINMRYMHGSGTLKPF